MGKAIPLFDGHVLVLPVLPSIQRHLFRGLVQQIHAYEGESVWSRLGVHVINGFLVG